MYPRYGQKRSSSATTIKKRKPIPISERPAFDTNPINNETRPSAYTRTGLRFVPKTDEISFENSIRPYSAVMIAREKAKERERAMVRNRVQVRAQSTISSNRVTSNDNVNNKDDSNSISYSSNGRVNANYTGSSENKKMEIRNRRTLPQIPIRTTQKFEDIYAKNSFKNASINAMAETINSTLTRMNSESSQILNIINNGRYSILEQEALLNKLENKEEPNSTVLPPNRAVINANFTRLGNKQNANTYIQKMNEDSSTSAQRIRASEEQLSRTIGDIAHLRQAYKTGFAMYPPPVPIQKEEGIEVNTIENKAPTIKETKDMGVQTLKLQVIKEEKETNTNDDQQRRHEVNQIDIKNINLYNEIIEENKRLNSELKKIQADNIPECKKFGGKCKIFAQNNNISNSCDSCPFTNNLENSQPSACSIIDTKDSFGHDNEGNSNNKNRKINFNLNSEDIIDISPLNHNGTNRTEFIKKNTNNIKPGIKNLNNNNISIESSSYTNDSISNDQDETKQRKRKHKDRSLQCDEIKKETEEYENEIIKLQKEFPFIVEQIKCSCCNETLCNRILPNQPLLSYQPPTKCTYSSSNENMSDENLSEIIKTAIKKSRPSSRSGEDDSYSQRKKSERVKKLIQLDNRLASLQSVVNKSEEISKSVSKDHLSANMESNNNKKDDSEEIEKVTKKIKENAIPIYIDEDDIIYC